MSKTGDPYKYFRVEAREILEDLSRGVLELETHLVPETLARLLRSAHTLKGAARVVRQAEIAEHAHAIEAVLVPLRSASAMPKGDAQELLRLVDAIAIGVAALGAPAVEARPAAVPEVDTTRTVRADVTELESVLEGISEARLLLRSIPKLAASGRNIADVVDQVDRELQQVRDVADRMRLVPASSVFSVLERTSRDAARDLGKNVVFEARGGDVRMEASVLAVVQSALVQLVRNAVAHGLEDEQARARAGKPREGRVTLTVTRSGQRVMFGCADDGRGIDVDAVKRAAAQRGIDTTTGDVFRWLSAAGVTTSSSVSQVAGHGIGLDVVRNVMEQLSGDVSIKTEAGKGTRIELVVVVSLSSFDALVVEASGLTAAVPLEAVRAATRMPTTEITRVGSGEQVMREGVALPFLSLARVLGAASPARAKAVSVLYVEQAGETVAVGVDRIVSVTNVVARPLPSLALADPIVSATTLDADGNPRLVLDPARLVASVGTHSAIPANDARPPVVVLVIDDSLTTRMLEQSILESAGYEVDLATSAEEALEMARVRAYSLFLVDVEMPGMDGFSFVKKTREDAVLSKTPAILVTSRNAPEDRRRGEEVGAKAYVVKSEFDQGALLATIRKLTGSR
jgi:two-component system chemotaxis sensor kinase CheA